MWGSGQLSRAKAGLKRCWQSRLRAEKVALPSGGGLRPLPPSHAPPSLSFALQQPFGSLIQDITGEWREDRHFLVNQVWSMGVTSFFQLSLGVLPSTVKAPQHPIPPAHPFLSGNRPWCSHSLTRSPSGPLGFSTQPLGLHCPCSPLYSI